MGFCNKCSCFECSGSYLTSQSQNIQSDKSLTQKILIKIFQHILYIDSFQQSFSIKYFHPLKYFDLILH